MTNLCRHPCASFPRCEVLDLRGSGPRESCCCFQTSSGLAHHQHPRTRLHTHPQHARTQHHRTRSASVIFSLSRTDSRATPTTLVSRSTHGVFLLSSSGFPPFFWPAFLSFFLLRVAPAALSFCLLRVAPCAIPARKQKRACSAAPCPLANKNMLAQRSLARTPMTDGRTKRRAVRRHG